MGQLGGGGVPCMSSGPDCVPSSCVYACTCCLQGQPSGLHCVGYGAPSCGCRGPGASCVRVWWGTRLRWARVAKSHFFTISGEAPQAGSGRTAGLEFDMSLLTHSAKEILQFLLMNPYLIRKKCSLNFSAQFQTLCQR